MFELKLENNNGDIVNINDNVHYIVSHISGLNPPSASLFMSKSANKKGAKHNGSILNERNVIITIKILGDIEVNRNNLYPWIDTEQYCKIHYRNGVKNVYCEGYIQDCPFDVFVENEIISLAIVCGDPYWKDITEISKDISAVLKQFTFPFGIGAAGIPFSTIAENNIVNVFNDGAETGVRITIKCNGAIERLSIFSDSDTTKRFTLNTTLQKNWIVVIDTEHSPKTCKCYKPDGTVENFLKYIANNVTWFTLKKGNNPFGYTADNGEDQAEINISFSNKYLGV